MLLKENKVEMLVGENFEEFGVNEGKRRGDDCQQPSSFGLNT